jgi:hypothetical protein
MTFAEAKFGIAGTYALPWMNEGDLPSLRGATGWLNSKPLTQTDLLGKVVLVDFGALPASIGDVRSCVFLRGPKNKEITAWW